MYPPLQAREVDVLERAVAALAQTTGLQATITHEPLHPLTRGDAFIDIHARDQTYRFLAEVKNVRHFATVGLVKEQLGKIEPDVLPLLVAPYVTRAIAEHCRELRLPFMDTAGNVYLEAPGLTVYVTGLPRPDEMPDKDRYRAFTVVGMKVLFALLCKPDLAQANYRTLAEAANVALVTVGPVIQDLENRGFLTQRKEKRLLTEAKRLMEEWVARYPDTLRPKLFRHRYFAERDRLKALDLLNRGYWGGEVAAQRLTGYLKPENFTLYLEGNEKAVLTEARMRTDPHGNEEVLNAFWRFPFNQKEKDVVPPLLAYADLMATGDGRNREAAGLIYDQLLKPLYD